MALAGCLREDHPLLQRVDEGFETSLASKAHLCSHRLHLFGITFFWSHQVHALLSSLWSPSCSLSCIFSILRFSELYTWYTMPYQYLSTPYQLAVTKHHICWQKNVTGCDCQKKNRISSIYHFVGWRKAEIGWIRPRRPSLKFCGERFGGGVQTQRCANSEGVPRYW